MSRFVAVLLSGIIICLLSSCVGISRTELLNHASDEEMPTRS